jgi:EAL domain-containing protein (putative c-di-GMP-specific phosphodiesterase class I)/CheY-like chemotaxis protein
LSLLYQPQVSLETGAIVGVEALLRWHCAEFGAVSPDEFIPIAERSGLIAKIGDWVIRQACLQSQRWRQAGLPAIRVGVNVSPVQFQTGDVVATIQRALMDTGVEPGSLGVEVTESAFLEDSERVAATLRTLKDSGVEIALDDFGTGLSSLSRLRRLPIDVIKVDRSFVSDITAAAQSASVTRSIISLAHELKIRVLAEGVETEPQVNMLVANGCDRFQGYFFSKAVPAGAIAAMLQESRRLPEHLTHRKARTRTLLLVDDEESIVSALKRLFRRDGYTILTARSGAQGLEILAGSRVDVILSDQRMPGMSGVEFLRQAKILCPDTIRMTLSGFTELQSIIDAVNEGAVYKFLTKPWDDDLLREHVAQAFQQKELADENRRLGHEITSANNNLAELNRRLELSLERERQTASLMQASAGGARDMVDVLPAAVFGIDPDGMVAYLNPCAAELLPDAIVSLGCEPAPDLQAILATLRAAGAAAQSGGVAMTIAHRACLGWLRRLSESDPARGEILVVAPCSEASTS